MRGLSLKGEKGKSRSKKVDTRRIDDSWSLPRCDFFSCPFFIPVFSLSPGVWWVSLLQGVWMCVRARLAFNVSPNRACSLTHSQRFPFLSLSAAPYSTTYCNSCLFNSTTHYCSSSPCLLSVPFSLNTQIPPCFVSTQSLYVLLPFFSTDIRCLSHLYFFLSAPSLHPTMWLSKDQISALSGCRLYQQLPSATLYLTFALLSLFTLTLFWHPSNSLPQSNGEGWKQYLPPPKKQTLDKTWVWWASPLSSEFIKLYICLKALTANKMTHF